MSQTWIVTSSASAISVMPLPAEENPDVRPDLPQIVQPEYDLDAHFYEVQKQRLLKKARRRWQRRMLRKRVVSVIRILCLWIR